MSKIFPDFCSANTFKSVKFFLSNQNVLKTKRSSKQGAFFNLYIFKF